MNDKNLLNHNGSVSNAQMEEQVFEIYKKFDLRRKEFDAKLADAQDLKELSQLEKKVKKLK